MRPKVVIIVFFAAFLVLGAALLVKRSPIEPKPAATMTETPAAPAIPAPASSVPETVVVPPPQTNSVTPEQRQEAVDAETDRLQQWSMKDDPASLSNILADLTNPEKEVREAAINATKEFGSTNAIPALKAAAEATEDLQEKIAYLDAAQFLTIPPIDFSGPSAAPTPDQVQREQQRIARRQTRHFRQVPGPNAPAAVPDSGAPGGPN